MFVSAVVYVQCNPEVNIPEDEADENSENIMDLKPLNIKDQLERVKDLEEEI